jgi:hypothetical protein
MSETITFREVKLEGGWLMVKPERDDLGKAMAVVRKHKDKLYDLEVKEHRKKRSLDANAYAWVLINKIADALRITPKEIYRQAIQNVGGNYEILPVKAEAAEHFKQVWEAQGLGWPCVDMGKSKIDGYRNLRAYYGSSTYSTTQMAQLIDILLQDCRALDIEVKSDEEIASIMGAWQ